MSISNTKIRYEINFKKGFTLLELLVVIAIIGILASVVMVSLSAAREKSRDSKRVQELKEVSKALEIYRATHGTYPNIVNVWNGNMTSANVNFESLAQILVDSGFLGKVPQDPIGNESHDYWFYPYGPDNAQGHLLMTYLESIEDTLEAPFGSCRLPHPSDAPPGQGANFTICRSTQNPTKGFCLCHPF